MPKLTPPWQASPWIAATGGSVVVKALSLAASVVLARFVGPLGRGVITAETLWSLLVINFASIVVVRCVVYFGRRFGKDGALRCIRMAGIVGVLLAGLVMLINWKLLAGKPSYAPANVYAITIPLSLVASAFAGLHLLNGHFGLFWIGEAVTAGGTALGVILLAAGGSLTPMSYAVIAVVAVAASLAIVAFTVRTIILTETSTPSSTFQVAGYAAALGATLLPFQINARIDQLVVSVSAPMRTLGYYSIAAAWASILSMLGAGFSAVILAESTKLDIAAAGNIQALSARVRRATVVLAAICSLATMATSIGVPLLYGHDFAPAIPAAVILSVASLVLYYNSLLHEVARGTGRPIIGWLPETAGLVTSLALLKVLYFRFGMVGAAVSSIVSYVVVSGILLYELRRSVPGLVVTDFIPTPTDVVDVGRIVAGIVGRTSLAKLGGAAQTITRRADDT